ncbi:MAG: hypothetical protein IKL80_02835 [Clostridia bacterium]|nr:hypothetical protein [Clostridia bacterium]
MIDFHAHVLPGIDDGARDVDEALMLLASQKAQGIHTVVATPHYTQEIPIEDFVKARSEALELLMAMPEASELPKVVSAAEVSLFYGLSELSDISQLCIENTNYMLIEMPFSFWCGWEYTELYNLIALRGIRPIIAHLDRYVFKKDDMKRLQELLNLEVLVQINASAILTFSSRRMVKELLAQDAFTVLGSDCHHPLERPCYFDKAWRMIQRKWGEEVLAAIHSNATAIISNERVQRRR